MRLLAEPQNNTTTPTLRLTRISHLITIIGSATTVAIVEEEMAEEIMAPTSGPNQKTDQRERTAFLAVHHGY